MQPRKFVVKLTLLLLVASAFAFGASGDKAKVKGMISGRTGETLIVNSADGKVTVVLTDDTKTQDKRGLFGLEKKQMGNVVLIPGLKVDVDGVSDDQGRIVAKKITVDGDDLETSQMIQAGLTPTAEQVAANMRNIEANRQGVAVNKEAIAANAQNISANKQQIDQNINDISENTKRFTALSEYDTKDSTSVQFAVGSSKLSKKGQDSLQQLAKNAMSITGYIIQVTGFADSTGSAAMNTKPSKERAQNVIDYLFQQCKVPMRHIVAPGAMGEYEPVASNENKAGRAENRRVEVKILVNKGIAGS